MLDVDSAVPFLVRRGLVREEEILAGDVAVEAVARRNRNLRVTISDTAGLFLKQPEDLARSSHHTLRVEADFYSRHLTTESVVAASLPRLLLYEPALPLLVLELLPAHQTLRNYCRSLPHHRFPIHTWRELGRRLGSIHRTLRQHGPSDSQSPTVGVSLPWVVQAHRPTPESLATLSPAGFSVLEILQTSTAIREGLDGLGQLWEPDTVIHGDIRAENILVRARAGATEDIRIIDWELRQVGDPAWDIAGFLEALVLYWLSGLPLAGEEDVEEMTAQSPLPWPVFQAASSAFWQGYLATHGGDDAWARAAVSKVAHFSAARMVQSALEMTAQRAELPPSVVLLLQVCENVFADPARASIEFFAIT